MPPRLVERCPYAHLTSGRGAFSSSEFWVDLDYVEQTIRNEPQVQDVAVLARTHEGGCEVTAYVVADGAGPERIRAHCRARLPGYMVPDRFMLVSSLPDISEGLVDENALQILTPNAEEVKPRTRFEAQVSRIWEEVLGVPDIGPRQNFFSLGGHSLLAVRLVAQMEKMLGVRVPLSIFFANPTIRGLLDAVGSRIAGQEGTSMTEIQPCGSRPPVFWTHTLGGGGGAGLFTYYSIVRRLSADQPSYGFVAREPPLNTIEEMAAWYIAEMRAVQPSGPYYLAGYCFGGVIAYEMARQLVQQGESVALTALIESAPPNLMTWRDRLSLDYFRHVILTLPRVALRSAANPQEMRTTLARRVARLRQAAVSRRVGPPLDPLEQLRRIIDIDRYPPEFRQQAEASWRALCRYQPKPYPGAVTIFHTAYPTVLKPGVAMQWRRLARTVVEKIIPGEHDTVLSEPHVALLAAQFARTLEAAQRGSARTEGLRKVRADGAKTGRLDSATERAPTARRSSG